MLESSLTRILASLVEYVDKVVHSIKTLGLHNEHTPGFGQMEPRATLYLVFSESRQSQCPPNSGWQPFVVMFLLTNLGDSPAPQEYIVCSHSSD